MENKNNLPLVSVCIPAYNHEKYIAETIESVINQDYMNLELIIINDGSKDKTDEVIKKYEQKCQKRFVRFEYRNRENKGLSATLNEMVQWSKGKYFTACASDDMFLSTKVSLLVNSLEKFSEDYAVAFGNAIFIDDNSNEIYIDVNTGGLSRQEEGTKFFLDFQVLQRNCDLKIGKNFGSYETLLIGNYLPAMSFLIKLDKIKEVGAWTSGNTIEDWEMWLKLSKNYKFAYIDEPVALYRWHENNTVKTMKFELIRDSIKLLENDKSYALHKGYENVFYSTLIDLVLQLRKYDKSIFLSNIFKYSKYPKFVYMLIFNIIEKIKKTI
ncbi:glycosyltransferase family 2 protein [Aliarcobacter cryaerophilus]|uniref:glycosyltransferase family 2 protein n=1 Tax=Aliarcobacter cryaerophilus TaxID=28198 RepID=UPI0021B2C5BE|nr:glycosyltransferase [Aliarcobacter cryaerophilus]MCT7508574.1 glycosyltransferase [Aliarcobacter cryaerophilus]